MIRRYIIHLALISLLLISLSCGKDNGGVGGSDDSPHDSTLTINPSTTTTQCDELSDPARFKSSLSITVKNAQGIPLNDVNLAISYPWASTASLPNGAVQFYDGDPDSGGSPQNSPMTAVTDENGAYTFWFTYSVCGGIEYKGDFVVTSGSLYQSSTFEVKKTTVTPTT